MSLTKFWKFKSVERYPFDLFFFFSLSPFLQLYISETAHERVRGTMGSCVQLMVVTGIMGAYVTGI